MKKTRGFTLVEMMVAVVVLSIGLLGLASLQTRSLQFNRSAYDRSQATILAYDIIDRMRANKAAALIGVYDIGYGTGPGAAADCETAACNTTDMATYDLNQWLCQLGNWNATAACGALGIEGHLALGDGQIDRNGTSVTVRIRWTDDRSEQNAANTFEGRDTEIRVSTEL